MADDLERLRFVVEADVYKNGQLAGQLRRSSSGGVAFNYLPDYNGTPVATSLPLKTGPVASAVGGLPTFFAGLLPEGHRLTVLRRAAKTSMDDELTLLLAVGSDVPGDVQVVPVGEPPTTLAPLAASEAAALDFATLVETPDRYGIPGVQAKASATMLTTPIHTAGLQAILKIDPPDYPHLAVNEALHLTAAKALGLPVATAHVVHDRRDRAGLLVERFDRVLDDSGAWGRLAMEDAAQVMNVLPAAKYNVAAEDVVLALSRVVKAPAVAVRNLYLQFVFAWLTGNGDLHAKNVSVLSGRHGGLVVAPMYDIPCTALYRDMTLALPVAGKTRNLRARHWAEFADAIGLPQRAAQSANQLALKAALQADLATFPFEGSLLHGAQRELRHRREEFR